MFLVSFEGADGPARATAAEMTAAALRAAGKTAAPVLYSGDGDAREGCGPPMAVMEDQGWNVVLPCNASMRDVAAALGAQWILAAPPEPLGAPVVALDSRAADDPRAIASWEQELAGLPVLGPDTPPSKVLGILGRKVFPMLPQRTARECGRCGLDCVRLAGEVVQGRREASDCLVLSSSGISVYLDGRRLELGGFPSEMVKRTARGMLSALKGYRPGTKVRIDLD
jgi:hypothetical protein